MTIDTSKTKQLNEKKIIRRIRIGAACVIYGALEILGGIVELVDDSGGKKIGVKYFPSR